MGYSPCPNDTFIMGALAANLVPLPFNLEIFLEDVETLNQWALEGILHVTKLSFYALGHALDKYALLYSGAALGRGCGPIIVGRRGSNINNLTSLKIATPGAFTTARLLLHLYAGKKLHTEDKLFSEIMPAVSRGEVDFGLVIHEGRFTYQDYGLDLLIDLGEWWEKQTGQPIPLGGIAIMRTLGHEAARELDQAIRKSLLFAQKNQHQIMPYILSHAQEMSVKVINDHISLYVNRFSLDLGQEGKKAIEVLFRKASEVGLIKKPEYSIFAYA